MEKSRLKILLAIIILLLIPLIFLIKLKAYNQALKEPNSESTEKVTFVIQQGETTEEILDMLVEKELLNKNKLLYVKIYLRANDLGGKIQAGTYMIPKNLNIEELFTTLQNGKEQDIWVTIPEGIRADEIGKIFEKEINNPTFSYDQFMTLVTDSNYISQLGLPDGVANLEGFLFPDKYAMPIDTTADIAIKKMVSNFRSKVSMEYTYQDIILASIVEREGYNNQDRPIIAGIITKRLAEGWLLQTDATLLYPLKDWKHVLTAEDLKVESPYNTYKQIGLPPTPICNPGLESILAIKNPQKTNYYYYIHDKNKNPHYAETLAEHNSNVNKYLR
ncbi:MAG: endolytic transglycosylase MltG [Candidatus Dojkabacteria bacterium]|jgi:UPF0755 protein